MDARSRSPRAGGTWPPRGQHFLRSEQVAEELVRDAGITRTDHVVEIGAGRGRLTWPLARRAGSLTAIEVDPALADRLHDSFLDQGHVRVVQGDFLQIAGPHSPWRAFGNIPFALTTPILRRLLDHPASELDRADLLIQFEAARKRSSVERHTLLSLGWLPWWESSLTRRLPRLAFDPPPTVDGGVLVVTRRPQPLLEPESRFAFVAMLRRAFEHGSWPVRRSLRGDLPPKNWKRLARERGIEVDAVPSSLDVWAWIEVFHSLARPAYRTGSMGRRSSRDTAARMRRPKE